ncbi:hypothetical protein FG386_000402 [Cryptosporidium ryanae]|uniref:uncharacterized protein n=1 Tax=Cryptosporidium ryanae TaxID=515981 RepID=UPI003519D931|nr:hypothetical protein FG386_000402 [Cryptosporidium ryanae]
MNRVIKSSDKRKVQSCNNMVRRRAIDIEIPNDIDTNSWDKFCTSVISFWCKDNRGVIIGRKNVEAKQWEIKTSLHPPIEDYVFEEIEELFDNINNPEGACLSLWGRNFYLNSNPMVSEKHVFFLKDYKTRNELIAIPYKNICAIFFCSSDNVNDFDCKTMVNFVHLVHRITNK